MYTTSLSIIQLMYKPLRVLQQSVPNLVVGVQTYRLDHYTSCGVGNVHDKFQSFRGDVRAATAFSTISTFLVVDVQTFCLDH